MTRQASIFTESEGRAWLERNEAKLMVPDDPVLAAISFQNLKPQSVLEIGCSNGWRLTLLQKSYGCKVTGVEPGKMDMNFILRGTADALPIKNRTFDLIIYGWCLYLCDREDLFKIAAEGDRALSDGGHLIIYDFHSEQAHKRKYHHHKGLFSYKCNYPKLWLGNPNYSMVYQSFYGQGIDRTSVTILRKSLEKGWPLYD